MSLGVPNDRRFPPLQSIQEGTSPSAYTGLDSFVSTGAAFSFQQVPTNPSTPAKAFTSGSLPPTSSPFGKVNAPAANIMNAMHQDGFADLDMDLMTDDHQLHHQQHNNHDEDFDIDLDADVGEAKYDDGDIDLDVDVTFNNQMAGFGQEHDYQMAGAGQGDGTGVVEEADDVMIDEMADAQQHQQQQQQPQQEDVMIHDDENAALVVESTSLTVEMSTAPAPSSPLAMDDRSSPVITPQNPAIQVASLETQTQTQPFPSTAETTHFQSHEPPLSNTQTNNSTITPTKPLSPSSQQSSQSHPTPLFTPQSQAPASQFIPSQPAAVPAAHFSPPSQQPAEHPAAVQRENSGSFHQAESAQPSREQPLQQHEQPQLPSPSQVGNVMSPKIDLSTSANESAAPLSEEAQQAEPEQGQQPEQYKDGDEEAQDQGYQHESYNQDFENHELDDQDFNNEVDNDDFNHEDDPEEYNQNVEQVAQEEGADNGFSREAGNDEEAEAEDDEEEEEETAEIVEEYKEEIVEEVRVSQAETASLDEESPELPHKEWLHEQPAHGNYQLDVNTSIATEIVDDTPNPGEDNDEPLAEENDKDGGTPQKQDYEASPHVEEQEDARHEETLGHHNEGPLHPIVVLYKDVGYSLYLSSEAIEADKSSQMPQSFILDDNSLASKPFADTMAALREVMVNEISSNEEMVFKITDLDLSFEEDNAQNKAFTLAYLAELYVNLCKQDGNSNPGPLYCELQMRPRYHSKFESLKELLLQGGGLQALKESNAAAATTANVYANDASDGNVDGAQGEASKPIQHASSQLEAHSKNHGPEDPQREGDEELELEEFEKVPEEELLGQSGTQEAGEGEAGEEEKNEANEDDDLELSEQEFESLQNADDLEESVVVGGKYSDKNEDEQNKDVEKDDTEQYDFNVEQRAEGGEGAIEFDEEELITEEPVVTRPSTRSESSKSANSKKSANSQKLHGVVQVKSRPAAKEDDIGEAITVQKSPAKPSVSTRSHQKASNKTPVKAANPVPPRKDWIKLGEPYDEDDDANDKDAEGEDDDFNFDTTDFKAGNNGAGNNGDASLDPNYYDNFDEDGEFSVYPDLAEDNQDGKSSPIGDHINVAPAGEKRARDDEEGDTIVVNTGFFSASKRRRAS